MKKLIGLLVVKNESKPENDKNQKEKLTENEKQTLVENHEKSKIQLS